MALRFWKPGAIGPGSSLDRTSEAEGNIVPSAPSYANLSIQAQREVLPIFKHREKLLHCVEKYGVIIVVGQTGCGKTTRQFQMFCVLFDDTHAIICKNSRNISSKRAGPQMAMSLLALSLDASLPRLSLLALPQKLVQL
jgi:ATP-dependent RNA helicase DDX35